MTRPHPAHAAGPVCIAGAGAIGLTLAARLAQAGEAVNVLARGQTLAALRAEGVILADRDGTHHATVTASDRPDFGVQHTLFLCAKAHDLVGLAETVAPMIGPQTRIVPVVNGIPWWYFQDHATSPPALAFLRAIDPDGRLSAALPRAQIVGAVTYITAERTAPSRAVTRNPLRMIVGATGRQSPAAAADVAQMLTRAGVATEVSPHLRTSLWVKVINNLATNPLSVVTGATLREIFSDPALAGITRHVVDEALAVAGAYEGAIDITPDALMAHGATLGDVRTSMLQDFDCGRPLELPAIGDAVVELGAHKGIPMPHTRSILDLARYRAATRTCRA